MKLFDTYKQIQIKYSDIPNGLVVIQVGNFYEILDKEHSIDLNQQLGLKLRKCGYCAHNIIGFNLKGCELWFKRIVEKGFIIILVDENPHEDQRRKKVVITRSVSRIITPSFFYHIPHIIMDTDLLTLRLVIKNEKQTIVKPISTFNNINQMVGAITKMILAGNACIEIFTDDNDTCSIEKRLQESGTVPIFIRKVNKPVLSSLLHIIDRNKSLGNPVIADDEPTVQMDVTVDSTSFYNLRIHEVKKHMLKQCRTSDGKHVLGLMLANPSTDIKYLQNLEKFREAVSTNNIPWTRTSVMFNFINLINRTIESSKSNIMNVIKELENIHKWVLVLLTTPYNMTIVSQILPQLKDVFTPTTTPSMDFYTRIISELKIVIREQDSFNPIPLMNHWKNVLKLTGHKATNESNTNRFLIKTCSGYKRHDKTDEFEDMYASEYMIHKKKIQDDFDNVLTRLRESNEIKTLAYFIGISDIYTHVNNGGFATINDSCKSIKFTNLCRPTHKVHDVTNDAEILTKCNIIRGSNGSGKSTFARAIALNVYLAQCGLSVSASYLSMPIFDAICLRFGAADDFKQNLSSFENECKHMSEILENSTSNTLTLIDELAMVCGENIGQHICQHVLRKLQELGCIHFFLTHYKDIERDLFFPIQQWTMGGVPYKFKFLKNKDSLQGSESLSVLRLVGIPDDIINLM